MKAILQVILFFYIFPSHNIGLARAQLFKTAFANAGELNVLKLLF